MLTADEPPYHALQVNDQEKKERFHANQTLHMRISEYQRTAKSHANTRTLPSFEKANMPKAKVYPLKNKLLITLFKNTVEIDLSKTPEKSFSKRCIRYKYLYTPQNHLHSVPETCFCSHVGSHTYKIPKVSYIKEKSCKNQLVSNSKYLYTKSYKVNRYYP